MNRDRRTGITILVIQRGYMLEHPRILYAERYEVGTISREDPKGNPQRLHAAHPLKRMMI